MKRVQVASRGFLPISQIAPMLNSGAGAQRAFIGGKTGGGKSFLTKRMLQVYQEGSAAYQGNLVIVDPNCTFKYPADLIVEEPELVNPTSRKRVIIYRPHPTRLDGNSWNTLWERLFNANVPRLMTFVDEVYAMSACFGEKRGQPNWLKAYLTRGRAVGRGAIMLAQRPRHIPIDVIAQAEHFCVFDMPHVDDRKCISQIIGTTSVDGESTLERTSLPPQHFWYVGPGFDYPHKMKASR